MMGWWAQEKLEQTGAKPSSKGACALFPDPSRTNWKRAMPEICPSKKHAPMAEEAIHRAPLLRIQRNQEQDAKKTSHDP